MKRVIDVLGSLIGLAVLAPVMAAIAIIIRRQSGPPSIFRQERIGRHGQPFTLYKFRTMHAGQSGPLVTAAGDLRITPVGRVLRRTKADELPQLWNVIKGDMSLVGPRPEVRQYVDAWPKEDRDAILSVRPGITDPVTVSLKHEELLLAAVADPEQVYRQEIMPRKVQGYVEYVREQSVARDLKIVLETLRALIRTDRHEARPVGEDRADL